MSLNYEKEMTNQKYNFLTEIKIIKSSSHDKLNRKFKLLKLDKNIKRKAKSKSRSPVKSHKKKMKKKNKIIRRHNGSIVKMNTFGYKFEVIFGKIYVNKKYLEELVKRKKLYSKKIKKIKIIKRNESVKPKEVSSLNIIKNYSLKVLKTNRAIINYQKKKEKELFEKLDNIDKNNLRGEVCENYRIKPKLIPSLKKINIAKTNLIPTFSNNKLNKNKCCINFEENNEYNFKSNNNIFNCNKKNEILNHKNLDKRDSLYKSTPDIINLKSINSRNSLSNLKLIINDSIKSNNIINQETILVSSPKTIEINESSSPKKIKREISEIYKDFHTLYYAIEPGNASYLIKNCMNHRTNWKETYGYITNLFSFKWVQNIQAIDYSSLGKISSVKQIVNHFKNNYCISNKANLFMNMMDYCEQRKISVFKYLPLTLIFELNMLDNIKNEKTIKKLERLKKLIGGDELKFTKKYEDMGQYFKEEEFIEEKKRRIEFIKETNKKNKILYYVKEEKNSLDEKYIFEGKYILYRDYFGKIKQTEKMELNDNWNLYTRKNDRQKLMNKYLGTNTVIELPDTHSNGKNLWLIKAIDLCQGKCIKMVNNYEKMMNILYKFKEGVNYDFTKENLEIKDNKRREPLYHCNKIIIQKYIEKPLLYKGRKFDMRIWVLVTHDLKVYFFKEGHLKTCSISFNINSEDAYTHITNYSFQKYNEYFQKYEKGNEVPFYEFQKYIDEKYPDKNYKIKVNLYSQIKEIVAISMKSIKEQIGKNKNKYQFEIFGYDLMLDDNFNLFLIEINDNPGLEESSPWITIIIPRMLDDALRLTIDQLFSPGYDYLKINEKDKNQQKFKKIMDNFKDEIKYDRKKTKTEINIIKKEEKEMTEIDKIKNEHNNTMIELREKINKREEIKIVPNKNNKYISPFPVPGYKNNENLWEFVCDLTNKDPLDDFLDKEEDKCYTGIRYLFKKRKNNEN